eukprot:5056700-Prorocentrum_lima.AAC.1
MTSSLVGSEMCIRDSHLPVQVVWKDAIETTPRTHLCRANTDFMNHQKAVSYTHLTLPTICSV